MEGIAGPWEIGAALAAIAVAQAAVNFGEASITSLPAARLKGLKTILGGPFWEAARRWLSHPEEYLTLLLLANNLLEAFFVWALLAGLSFWISGALERNLAVWFFGGAVNLFFLTVVPKVLGRKLSHGMFGAWILRILYAALVPFYPILRFFFFVVGKLSGGGQSGALGKEVSLSFEELRELVDYGKEEIRGLKGAVSQGILEAPRERSSIEMAASYLGLKDVLVRDVMTPKANVSAVDWDFLVATPSGSPQQERLLFSLMTDGHTRTIALKKGLPAGYIHAKDFLKHTDPVQGLAVHDWASLLRPIAAVHAGQKLINILPLLAGGCPIAYVVGAHDPADAAEGSIPAPQDWVGIITAEDFMEEITGEILDEFEHRKRGGTGIRREGASALPRLKRR